MKKNPYKLIKLVTFTLILLVSLTLNAQVKQPSKPQKMVTKGLADKTSFNLEITAFDYRQIKGIFQNGQKGISFSSEILPQTKILQTQVATLNGVELVYLEMPLIMNASSLQELKYFGNDFSFSYTATQMVQRNFPSQFASQKDFETFLKNKFTAHPEMHFIPQLAVTLGVMNLRGDVYPAVLQLMKVGLQVAKMIDAHIAPQSFAVKNNVTARRSIQLGKKIAYQMASNKKSVSRFSATIQLNESPGVRPGTVTAKYIDPLIKMEEALEENSCACYFSIFASGEIAAAQAAYCDEIQIRCTEMLTWTCEEYPNQENGCYGMCGPGCTCWPSLCGNCCFHEYCAEHDSLCGEGVAAIGCIMIIPIGSTCNWSPGLLGAISGLLDF